MKRLQDGERRDGLIKAYTPRSSLVFPRSTPSPKLAPLPANASPETIISARPDLFVVSVWQPGWDQVTGFLDRAGIPVIFLDGPANTGRDPAEAIAYSIQLLGQVTGRSEQATAYADFVQSHYRRVTDPLKTVNDHPGVLIDAFAGSECCSTPGRNNRLKQSLELAGGRALGTEEIAGYEGRLNPEAVLGLDPDIYIGTGAPKPPVEGGLVLGGGIEKDAARVSLERVVSQSIRRELRAVREGRAYAVNHQISISVLSVLIFECFAKWTHPDLFADVDPAATMDAINSRFLPVPLKGTFWVGLKD